MRRQDLSFLKGHARYEDFFKNYHADLFKNVNFEGLNIPHTGGVYIFVSKEQKFIYPCGESRVIYIGESCDLYRRLNEHRRKYQNVVGDKNYTEKYWEYNRYFYMESFGCDVYFITKRGLQVEKNLESEIFGRFYDKYHAIPVGNSALSFRKEKNNM